MASSSTLVKISSEAGTLSSFTILVSDTLSLLTTVQNLLEGFTDTPITSLTANELIELLDDAANGKYQAIQEAAKQLRTQLDTVEQQLSFIGSKISLLKEEGETDLAALKAKVKIFVSEVESIVKPAKKSK